MNTLKNRLLGLALGLSIGFTSVLSAQAPETTDENFETPPGGVAGTTGQVQYNNGGVAGGISEGTATDVLTSNGPGVPPSFQAGGGGGGAPTTATYITQTANASLSNEQALASLATGILSTTTTTGVLSSDADFAWNGTTNILTMGSTSVPATITAPAGVTTGIDLGFKATNSVAGAQAGSLNFTAGNSSTLGLDGRINFITNLGTLAMGDGDVNWTANLDFDAFFITQNTSTGTQAYSHQGVLDNNGTKGLDIAILNTGYTGGLLTNDAGTQATYLYATGNIPVYFGSNGVARGLFDTSNNWVMKLGSNATSDTNGFVYLPKVAGTPTGVPANLTGVYANATPFRYDSTNNLLYAYNSSWLGIPSVAASPTWTGIHTFSSAEPRTKWSESDQTTDEKLYDFDCQTKVCAFRTRTDADGAGVNILAWTRGTGTAITNISLGNATNNPTGTWLGSGTFSFGSSISAGATITATAGVVGARVIVNGTTIPANGIYISGTNRLAFASNTTYRGEFDTGGQFILGTLGAGISLKEGSNAKMGTCTLVVGTCTVSTTAVTANSRIFLTAQSLGTVTVPSGYGVSARTAATSFVILASAPTDTSVVAWMIMEPSP